MTRPVAAAERLGAYQIVTRLARGGMAELFLAKMAGPQDFEKLVAIKKILPDLAADPEFVKAFLAEAQMVATLDHPHIAQVYGLGQDAGSYFITMEYVHGQSVSNVLQRSAQLGRRVPIDHGVQIARSISAALHYAHERRGPTGVPMQIVHRDVSPSNILVAYDGAVKLVDFGVAKNAASTAKTKTGFVKGKVAYMSPEQVRGQPVDRRGDIFALGIVMWELATTQRLYKGDNEFVIQDAIVRDRPVAPSTVNRECLADLDRIILRALQADPAARYQSAEELEVELEEFAREHKLRQSAVGLRQYMHQMFDPELAAWKEAQDAGLTLTDHMVASTSIGVPAFTDPPGSHGFDDDDDDEADATEHVGEDVPGEATIQVDLAQIGLDVDRSAETRLLRGETAPGEGEIDPPTALHERRAPSDDDAPRPGRTRQVAAPPPPAAATRPMPTVEEPGGATPDIATSPRGVPTRPMPSQPAAVGGRSGTQSGPPAAATRPMPSAQPSNATTLVDPPPPALPQPQPHGAAAWPGSGVQAQGTPANATTIVDPMPPELPAGTPGPMQSALPGPLTQPLPTPIMPSLVTPLPAANPQSATGPVLPLPPPPVSTAMPAMHGPGGPFPTALPEWMPRQDVDPPMNLRPSYTLWYVLGAIVVFLVIAIAIAST